MLLTERHYRPHVLALMGCAVGWISSVILGIAFSGAWQEYLLSASVAYGWSAAWALPVGLSTFIPVRWRLVLGIIPLALWAVVFLFGVGDPFAMPPLVLYGWASIDAFELNSELRGRSRT